MIIFSGRPAGPSEQGACRRQPKVYRQAKQWSAIRGRPLEFFSNRTESTRTRAQ